DQRFRNTARDGRDTGRLSRFHTRERVDDTDYRAEQTDERCGRTDRRQTGEAALEFRRLNGRGALQRAFGRVDDVARDVVAHLVSLELLQTGVDHDRQVALAVTIRDVDRLFNAVIFQRLGYARREFARLITSALVGEETLDH